MSNKSTIINEETGEVIDQSLMVSPDDGLTIKQLIPLNRMTNIAKSVPVRIAWDKKAGKWVTPLGEFTELELFPTAATELYAVWSSQVGKPEYYGTTLPGGYEADEIESGYRVAFIERKIGPCYGDFFGLTRDFAEAVCKIAHTDKNANINVKGSTVVSTSNGPFHKPKIV